MISFNRPVKRSKNRELVRLFHTTGTLGTALKHPKKGKTQLFRRDVTTLEELPRILKNPRVNTDKGYQRISDAPGGADGQPTPGSQQQPPAAALSPPSWQEGQTSWLEQR